MDASKRIVERAVTDYYAAFSKADLEEQRLWGEFALEEFSAETSPAE